ncbi:DCC family protein [Scenedesmus sp. PABB004]|nr:DCC family protein [Scenedesmus sp. PABB004]
MQAAAGAPGWRVVAGVVQQSQQPQPAPRPRCGAAAAAGHSSQRAAAWPSRRARVRSPAASAPGADPGAQQGVRRPAASAPGADPGAPLQGGARPGGAQPSGASAQRASVAAAEVDFFATDKRPVILYDGVCNLCNGAVNFMLDWDRAGAFRLAALQSGPGRELLARCGRAPDDISSIVLVEERRCHVKSEAVRRIAAALGAPLQLLAALAAPVPRFIRDPLYDQVANNRYLVFGRTASCRVSDDGFADRFLGDFAAGASAQAERVAALRSLAGLKELRALQFAASDDAEVAALAAATQVTTLTLRLAVGSACTPAGLMALARMTWLRTVRVDLLDLELCEEDAEAWLRALHFARDAHVLAPFERQRAVWAAAEVAARGAGEAPGFFEVGLVDGPGGAMAASSRAWHGAPPPDDEASPLLRALAALDDGVWAEALLPKLRADAGSAPAFALACRETRRLVQSSAPALSLRAADCAHAASLARLGQRFTGCSEVEFTIDSSEDAGAPLATLLPALARLPRLTSLRLDAAASAAASEPAFMVPMFGFGLIHLAMPGVDAAASAAASEPAFMAPVLGMVHLALPGLRSLELVLGSSWADSDAAWRVVGLATQLTRVAVRFDSRLHSTVTLRHLSALTAVSGLASLVVDANYIADAQHYGFLAGLPALTHLDLPLMPDHPGLPAIAACTSLRSLLFYAYSGRSESGTFSNPTLSEAKCAALARCTRLTVLDVPVDQGSDPHLLAALAALTGLQKLTIEQLSRASLPCLASLSQLTRLQGSWVEDAAGGVGGALIACPSVVQLWGSGPVPFEAFPRLRDAVQRGTWPPTMLERLAAHCSGLTALDLCGCEQWAGPSFDASASAQAERVAALRALAGLNRLRWLSFSASDDAEVEALTTATQVLTLVLRVPEGSACTPSGLMALARMTWLRTVRVDLLDLELCEEDAEAWLRALHFARDAHVLAPCERQRAVWAAAEVAARGAGEAPGFFEPPARAAHSPLRAPRPGSAPTPRSALPGGAMLTRARARCGAAPPPDAAASPLLRALAALDDGVWAEALLPKLREDAGSAPAFALTCREARRLVQSSTAALSLRAADCAHAAPLARLGQRFTGCREVALVLTSPGDAGAPLATLLPALARLPRLTSLRLDAAASAAASQPAVVAPAIAAAAAKLPGLRSLELVLGSSWEDSDAAWQALGGAAQLTHVAARFDVQLRSTVTLSHMSALTALSGLASLDVRVGTPHVAQHYGFLAGLPALTQLVLPLMFDRRGLDAIGACTGLRSLAFVVHPSVDYDSGTLVWPTLGEAECAALARCTRLTSLNILVHQGSDPRLLAALAALTGLQRLTIEHLSRASLPCLASLSRLTQLQGSWVAGAGGGVGGASTACQSVVQLWGGGPVPFEAFPSTTWCLHDVVQIGAWPPATLQGLAAHCSGLTALDLCGCELWAGPSFEAGASAQAERVAALRGLAGLKELRVLGLSASDDAEVAALAAATQVTGLILRVPEGSACTPAGLMALARMTWLRYLWLEPFGLELAQEDARALLRALQFVRDVHVSVAGEGQHAVWAVAAAAAAHVPGTARPDWFVVKVVQAVQAPAPPADGVWSGSEDEWEEE